MNSVPPPGNVGSSARHNSTIPAPSSGLSKQGYSTMTAISQNALTSSWGTGARKRAVTEDEWVECIIILDWDYYSYKIKLMQAVNLYLLFFRYFDQDDEEQVPELAYIPSPGSPTR